MVSGPTKETDSFGDVEVLAVGFVAAFDNAHGTDALDGFAGAGRDGQFAADGNVCAVADKADIVVDVQGKVHVDGRGGRCFFWGFAQYDHVVVEGRHGGFFANQTCRSRC